MIEEFLNTKFDPAKIFNLEDITNEELISTARDLAWDQASLENLETSKQEHGFRSDLYLYYALYKGQQEGLKDIDLFSFAGLMTSLFPGLGASFGTDTYKKEEIIEYRAIDMYNLLLRASTNPLQLAKIIVEYCLEQYKTLIVERRNLVPRNYTLREDQVRMIHEYTNNNGLKNDSEGLRDVVDAGLNILIKKED